MSAELSNVDHGHADAPIVTLRVAGPHDMSRLVLMLMHGNSEQARLGRRLVDRLKRTPIGRDTLRLLNAHGGPNFTSEPTKEARRWRAIDQLVELQEQLDAVTEQRDQLRSFITELQQGPLPRCAVCERRKAPLGRSVPPEAWESWCHPQDSIDPSGCSGYREDPRPTSIFPGECLTAGYVPHSPPQEAMTDA